MNSIANTATKQNVNQSSTRLGIVSGIITGQLAGLIMAVVVIGVFVLFLDKSFYFPVQVIGSAIFGESAFQGFHFGPFVAGLILHQAGPSLLWGVIFGLAASKLNVKDSSTSLFLGLGVGILTMLGPYVLIPTIMNLLHGVDYWNREVPIVWDWAAHIVFGGAFILYPNVRDKFKVTIG